MQDDCFFSESERYLKEFLLMLKRPISEREDWYKSDNSWEFADDIRSFGRAFSESSSCSSEARQKLHEIVMLAERLIDRATGGYVSWLSPEWKEMEKIVEVVIAELRG